MSVSQPLAGRTPGVVVLERTYAFSSSHRYFRPEWSPERNLAVFGKCSNFPAHGHNYKLTVEVSGTVDRETGFAVNLPELDGLVRAVVVDRLDHAHINDAVPEFAAGRGDPDDREPGGLDRRRDRGAPAAGRTGSSRSGSPKTTAWRRSGRGSERTFGLEQEPKKRTR